MSEPHFASLGPTLLARKGGAKPAMRPQLAPLPENFGEEVDEDKLEDLGWNDMGGDEGVEDPVSALDFESHGDDLIVNPLRGGQVVSITSRKSSDEPLAPSAANEDTPGKTSLLVRHQDKSPARNVLVDAAMDREGELPESDEPKSDGEVTSTADGQPSGPLLREKNPAVKAGENGPTRRPHHGAGSRRAQSGAQAGGRRAAFTLRLDPERHLKLRLASTLQGISAQALLTEALDAMLEDFEELDALAAHMKRH